MNDEEYLIMGINPCIWGLNYHNPSVVLVYRKKIIYAIEEERINRVKNSMGIFPQNAVEECKKISKKLNIPIKKVVIGFQPHEWINRVYFELEASLKYNKDIFMNSQNEEKESALINTKEELDKIFARLKNYNEIYKLEMLITMKLKIKDVKIQFKEHHLCHALSAYTFSDFDKALCLICDGVGEYNASTIWIAESKKMEKIFEIDIPNSLGYFYAIATAYLGFKPWNDEGKLMALAPYGKYNKDIFDKFRKAISFGEGKYDVSFFIENCLINGLALDIEKAISIFENYFGIPRRLCKITKIYMDIAFAVQTYLEEIVVSMINYWSYKTGIRKICVAGGIFMNCKLNMTIREKAKISKLFIQPISGDAGTSIGAAYSEIYISNKKLNSLAFGNRYSNKEFKEILNASNNIEYEFYEDDKLCNKVVHYMVNRKIVCWFQGAAEFGARALGNRSLIMDPRMAENADIMNERIKHREKWRPFACSMLYEYANEILENFTFGDKPYFMIEAYKVKPEWRNKISAVIHPVDYTTRPQLVKKENYPLYYNLIQHFFDVTGIPLIMNTSFNDKGEPIVLTPKNAMEFFLKSTTDILVMGNFLVKKEKKGC